MSLTHHATAGPIAVIGGCGYIGAHVVHALAEAGRSVVIVDDMSSGRVDRVAGHEVHRIDVADERRVADLADVLAGCSGVIHLAARKSVAESVADPMRYYRENLDGLRHVLAAMVQAGVNRLVFSSTAAVYGPSSVPVREGSGTEPASPYGRSKLAGEWLVASAARAHRMATASLRYFNVAGASSPLLAEEEGTSLLPRAIGALRRGETPQVFGTDYDTADGSAIRDYVHVADVARAHVAVAQHLEEVTPPSSTVLNIGTGRGVTVLELLAELARASGTAGRYQTLPRRAGDLPCSTADVTAITKATGWRAEHGLAEIVADAWALAGPEPTPGAPQRSSTPV